MKTIIVLMMLAVPGIVHAKVAPLVGNATEVIPTRVDPAGKTIWHWAGTKACPKGYTAATGADKGWCSKEVADTK